MAFFRRIVEDYEARLAPPPGAIPGGSATGKAEHERFEDGEVQFEVRGRGLGLPDGTDVEIHWNGRVIARVPTAKGRVSLRLSNKRDDQIPTVQAGDRLDVVSGATQLLTGVFHPD